MCPGRFRDIRTQLVGTNGLPLHHVPGRLRGSGTQLAGANLVSATGQHCPVCPGRFRGPGTHKVDAVSPPAYVMCLSRFHGMHTQLVGAIVPPIYIKRLGDFHSMGTEHVGAKQRLAVASYAPVAFAAPGHSAGRR
eukprot:jgi/Tetstr1/444825/TSEL_032667.t1